MSQKPLFLTGEDLADRWKISKRTLEGWRFDGSGPAYTKIGRHVRYPVEEIEKYEDYWRSTNQFDANSD